jgi:universal stress protein E
MRATGGILVGTDFTTGGETALARAGALARSLGRPLVAVHALLDRGVGAPRVVSSTFTLAAGVRGEGASPGPQLRSSTRVARDRLSAALRAIPVKSRGLVRLGTPYKVLLDAAKASSARLLVAGVHRAARPFERFFLGTTSERLLRAARIPVLLARSAPTRAYRRVVVACDLGGGDARVIAAAREVVPDALLILTHVIAPAPEGSGTARVRAKAAHDALSDLAARARLAEDRHEVLVASNEPRRGILAVADERKADLIVVGTAARKGVLRWVLGSVAEYVLRAAPVDALAVPPR